MLIDGEKWACDACIRGHRVSTCNHHDRPLSHINKKGRPVSQCPHCRGLRKARATHSKCECGEKPHNKADCAAESHAKAATGNRKQCCCGHGSRCTCATKRDSNLETVPEAGPVLARRSTMSNVKRPHIVASKKHKEASKRAHPYSIPRSRTANPTSVPDYANRSIDHLPSSDTYTPQSVSTHQDSITSAPRPIRRVRSEHGSPVPDFGDLGIGPPLTLDMSFSTFPDQHSLASSLVDYRQHSPGLYYSSDADAVGSAISGPSIDWSTFDFPYGSDSYATTYSQAASYTSYEYPGFQTANNLNQPSSGDTSDVDDFGPIVTSAADPTIYHLVNPSNNHLDMPAQFPMSQDFDSVDLDAMLHANGTHHGPPPPHIPIPPELGQYSMPQTLSPTPAEGYNSNNNTNTNGNNSANNNAIISHIPFTAPEVNDTVWMPTPYPTTTHSPPLAHNHQNPPMSEIWHKWNPSTDNASCA
ncbi:hypothetical protein FQN57_004032 [Myotisia sp. PD_48]|nr:hypothetical protein FQN57_004032 [Myotisia sp. PD_48]